LSSIGGGAMVVSRYRDIQLEIVEPDMTVAASCLTNCTDWESPFCVWDNCTGLQSGDRALLYVARRASRQRSLLVARATC
jgi:hypothetical protein